MGLNHLDHDIQVDFLDPEITLPSRALSPFISLGPIKDPFFAANLIQQTRALLRQREYDVLLLRDLKNLFIPALSRKFLGTGIFTIVLDATISRTGRFHSSLTPFLQAVDVVAHNTRAMTETLAIKTGIDKAKLWYLPYGVDASFFAPETGVETRGIVSVGDTNRDYGTLLASMRKLGLKCKIFASRVLPLPGRQTFNLKDIPPSLATVSTLPVDLLRHEYASADVIVIPLHEARTGSGVTSLLEAMSMGKAIVVAGTHGLSDYIERGRTVLSYSPGDSLDLARQLDRLLHDENLRERLGREARKQVERSFSTVAAGNRIDEFLRTRVSTVTNT